MTGMAARKAAEAVFGEHGGVLTTGDALDAGIHPRTLYGLRDAGVVERLSRGVYRLAAMPPLAHPDLVAVSLRVPHGVVCLVSALAFHELTDHIPHEVHLAVPAAAHRPTIDYPPVRVFAYAPACFTAGVQEHRLDGVPVRIYGPEKSIIDCFRFRAEIGVDVALDALRSYVRRPYPRVQQLLDFAGVCRVKTIVRPYLEALA